MCSRLPWCGCSSLGTLSDEDDLTDGGDSDSIDSESGRGHLGIGGLELDDSGDEDTTSCVGPLQGGDIVLEQAPFVHHNME